MSSTGTSPSQVWIHNFRRAARAKGLSHSLWVLLIVGLLAPTSAAAQWTAPVDLSEAGRDASEPQVGVDADGDAVFTWAQSDGANMRIQARARAADGTLGPVQTLSAAGQDAANPQIGVDTGGDAVFTWARSDGTNVRIQARARAADGTLGAVQRLSPAGQDAANPQIGVDGDGDAVFTWARFDGANYRIQARARAADGTLSAVRTVSPAGYWAEIPQVGIDEAGDSVFTWQFFDGPFLHIQARGRAADGTLGPVRSVTPGNDSAGTPQVAVAANGDAVFTWQRFAGVDELAQTRRLASGGTLSAVQNVSEPAPNEPDPQVAVDPDGDAAFTWSRSDGTNSLVETRSRSAAGSLFPFTVLSDSGQDASSPQVAVDPAGDAVVTWTRSDGANVRIQASAGP
jgi:hypothetical protein